MTLSRRTPVKLTIRSQNALDALFTDLEGRQEVANDDNRRLAARRIGAAMHWLNDATDLVSFPIVLDVITNASELRVSVENARELADDDEYAASDLVIEDR
jgi:hypothetical protein